MSQAPAPAPSPRVASKDSPSDPAHKLLRMADTSPLSTWFGILIVMTFLVAWLHPTARALVTTVSTGTVSYEVQDLLVPRAEPGEPLPASLTITHTSGSMILTDAHPSTAVLCIAIGVYALTLILLTAGALVACRLLYLANRVRHVD